MKESQRPFLELVLTNTDKYTERQVKSFLEGDKTDPMLSKAYELWSYGNNGGASDLLIGTLTLEQCKEKTKAQLQGIRGKEKEPDEEIKATPA